MNRRLPVHGLVLLLLWPLILPATEYFVGGGGSDGNSGTSWAQRFLTIGKGVQTATTPGDIVTVGDVGPYNESLNNIFPSGTAGNLITLRTTNGLRATLRPASADFVIQFSNQQTEHYMVSGFILDGTNVVNDVVKITSGSRSITLTNCDVINSPDGQGILISTADGFRGSDMNTIVNCLVGTNGILHYGGGTDNHGVYIRTHSNVVDGCTIVYNQSHGIHNAQGPSHSNTYKNSRVSLNQSVGIGLYSGTNNVVFNNVCFSNTIGFRAGFEAQRDYFLNNTAWKNQVNMQAMTDILGPVTFENNITANATHAAEGYGLWIKASGGAVTNRNNLAHDNIKGNYQNDNGANTVEADNLFSDSYDAQFTDAAGGDFSIGASSSARNSGRAQTLLSADIIGVARPQESFWDMGAYEYNAGGTTPTVSMSTPDSTATEEGLTTGTFRVTRTTTSGTLNVVIAMSGTAVNGTDYTTISSPVQITAGNTFTDVTLTPLQDVDVEGDQTAIMTIQADAAYTIGTPAAATITIIDNDFPAVAARSQGAPGTRNFVR